MDNPLKLATKLLDEIIPDLKSDSLVSGDAVEYVVRACFLVFGYTHAICEQEGTPLERFTKGSNAFHDFMELYCEFIYHVVKRQLDEIEIDTTLKNIGL